MNKRQVERAKRAFEHLPIVVDEEQFDPIPNLALLPDNAVQTINMNGYQLGDGVVLVAHPGDLYELSDILEGMYDFDSGAEYMDYAVPHEIEHETAIRQLGARTVLFGIEAYWLQSGTEDAVCEVTYNPFCMAVDFRTTKLGLALTYAYPTEPSPGDIKEINALGYKGVGQVGLLAVRYNLAGGCGDAVSLPVPLSYGIEASAA